MVLVYIAVVFVLRREAAARTTSLSETTDTKQSLNYVQIDAQLSHWRTTNVATGISMNVTTTDGTTVTVRPEKNTTIAARASNVYVSVLTVPVFHKKRLSYQLMTWIPTFTPRQVHACCQALHEYTYLALQKSGGSNQIAVFEYTNRRYVIRSVAVLRGGA